MDPQYGQAGGEGPPDGAPLSVLWLGYRASTNFVLSLISAGPGSPLQAAQGYLVQFKVEGSTPKSQPQPAVAGTTGPDPTTRVPDAVAGIAAEFTVS